MAMYLNNIQIISIMKIGRWKSTAFLDYIRSQVEEFTVDVSSKMLQTTMFRHLRNPSTSLTSLQQDHSNIKNGPSIGHVDAVKMVGASHSQRGLGAGTNGG
jgi:hypothetical protein